MKRVELIQTLTRMGCVFIRHGGKHDWHQKLCTKLSKPVPRHREIREHLARSVIKRQSEQA